MRFLQAIALAAVATIAIGSPAKADFIAYDVPANLVGNTSFGGSVGLDFNVNSSIYLTGLGVFDSGSDGLNAAHVVSIYNRDTQSVVTGASVTIPAGSSAQLIDGSRFLSISPIILGAGNYSVVTDGLTGLDALYVPSGFAPTPPSTTNTGNGLIAFVGTGRFSSNAGVYPTANYPGSAPNPFSAGTFLFTAVPEPGSIALLGLGAMGLLVVRRRSRRGK